MRFLAITIAMAGVLIANGCRHDYYPTPPYCCQPACGCAQTGTPANNPCVPTTAPLSPVPNTIPRGSYSGTPPASTYTPSGPATSPPPGAGTYTPGATGPTPATPFGGR